MEIFQTKDDSCIIKMSLNELCTLKSVLDFLDYEAKKGQKSNSGIWLNRTFITDSDLKFRKLLEDLNNFWIYF